MKLLTILGVLPWDLIETIPWDSFVAIPGPGDIADAIIERVVNAVDTLIETGVTFLTDVIAGIIETIAGPALQLMLFVPSPLPVGRYFSAPRNAPWGEIYDYLWTATIPLGFSILIVSWQVGQAGSAVGAISVKKTRKIDRGLFAGIFLIPASYVLAAIFLQFVNYMTEYIAPDPDEVASVVVGLLNITDLENGGIWLLAYVLGGTLLTIALLAIVINIVRVVFLFMITVLLPVLMGLKFGGVPYFEKWADKFINMYVSLALASVIMAAGFRLTLILLEGGINISGIPASDFLMPIFAMIPFALGVIIPFGAISNSLNITSAASAASLGAGAAGTAVSRGKKLASKGKSAASKAGGEKAKKAAKSEYSKKRQIDNKSRNDDLEANAEESQSSVANTSEPKTSSGVPDTIDSEIPKNRPYDHTAGDVDADYVYGVASDSGVNEGDDNDSSEVEEESDDRDNESSAGSRRETASAGAGTTTDSGTTGRSPVGGPVGVNTPSQTSSSSGGGERDPDRDNASRTVIGGPVGERASSGESSAGADADGEDSSPDADDTWSDVGSVETTPERLSNEPESVPEAEKVDLSRVQYREDPDVDEPLSNNYDGDTSEPGGYFEDENGNRVPVETSEIGPDFEHGEVYDVSGLETRKYGVDEDGESIPDAVSNEKIEPGTDGSGEFVAVNARSATETTKTTGRTYSEDVATRVEQSVNDKMTSAKENVSSVRDHIRENRFPASKAAVSGAKSGAQAAKQTAGSAKGSVINKADESLLTEEARRDLGKRPTEISEGVRVQTESSGGRVSTGRVKATWTDEQVGKEMAAVDFDGEDGPDTVPVANLTLSESSPAGKTRKEGDE